MSAPLAIVRRIGPGHVNKTYGAPVPRDVANRIALAAIEKHPGSIVIVEPVAAKEISQ